MNNFSTTGYKDDSPDRNNSHNVIPGRSITMKGVSKSLTLVPIVNGKPQYDRKRTAKPGDPDIEFESDVEGVLELPYAQIGGGGFLNPNIFKNITGISQNQFTPDNTGVYPGTSYAENVSYQNPYGNQTGNSVPQPLGNLNIAPPTSFVPQPGAFVNQQAPPQAQNGVTDQRINQWNSQASTFELGNNAQVTTDPNLLQEIEAERIKKREAEKQKRPFNGAINPYGGWNMENTATALGAFAQDKNILGTVASAGKLLLSGTRNAMSGAAAMKNYRESMQEYEDDMQDAERNQGWHWMQKGGKIGKLLTGNYITGDDDNPNPNVEFEKGEYAQTPDGRSMEVLGDRHSDGGELATLPEGSKVVSDYLKIGSKLATYFKKEYNLNVKSGSTFSTVLDQYKRKIGLAKLIEEEAKLMEKIADQEEVEFEGTREINLEVLSKKVNEMKPEKEELEDRFNTFTNLVYEKQEQSKEPGQNNFEKQEGGDVQASMEEPPIGQTPPQSPEGQAPMPEQQGGGSEIEQIIVAYAQMTGQDPAMIVQQLQELPEDQLEQAIQQIVQQVQSSGGNESQEVVQPTGVSEEEKAQPDQTQQYQRGGGVHYAQIGTTIPYKEFETILANYQWDANYEYGNLPEQAKAIVPFLERNGIKYNPEDLKTQVGMDKLAGMAQEAFRTNYKGVSNDYSSKVASTQKGLQTALDNKLITETELKKLGVKVNDGKVLRGSKGIVPKENEQKVVEIITKKGKDNPEAFNTYVDNNFVDNKWYFRNPNIRTVEFDSQQEIDDYVKKNGLNVVEEANGRKIYDTSKQGLYFNPVLKGSTPPATPAGTPPATPENPDPTAGIDRPNDSRGNMDNGLPMLVPDQSNLPPNYIPTTLRQVGSVQANAIAVSPESTLMELNRQYNNASNQMIQNNPYTAGAMLANLQAQTNSSTNQAYSQAAMANSQDRRNVENINEERIQNRDITNTNAMAQYEKEAIVGLDNYVQSWRNYIDNKNLQNVNNWNLENQRQAFNAVNDNYKIGSMGWYQTDEEPVFYVGNDGSQYMYNKKTKQSTKVTQKSTDGRTRTESKTETTRQKGGLILSKDIKKWLK